MHHQSIDEDVMFWSFIYVIVLSCRRFICTYINVHDNLRFRCNALNRDRTPLNIAAVDDGKDFQNEMTPVVSIFEDIELLATFFTIKYSRDKREIRSFVALISRPNYS